MTKQFSRALVMAFSVVALSLLVPSCGVKDSTIQTAAEQALKANPDLQGVMVNIKDGIATLSGSVSSDALKAAAETALSGIKGLKSTVNNISVAAPPPVVTISPDDALTSGVTDAIKDNPGVQASVQDGVITLTGEIKKTDLPVLMQKLNSLQPKKIDNKLTVN